jgi:hypothetical protein
MMDTPGLPREVALRVSVKALNDCVGPNCEAYSGLVPRRYCKKALPRVQRLIESRGLSYGCFINNGTPSGRYSLI